MTLLLSFLVMLLAVAGMAAGALLGGRRLQGSCGGLDTIEGLEDSCIACPSPCEERQLALAAIDTPEAGAHPPGS